jgi:hypothetical protein
MFCFELLRATDVDVIRVSTIDDDVGADKGESSSSVESTSAVGIIARLLAASASSR